MPHYTETLELRITIQYHGVKATQFFSKFTSESEEVLRKDLLQLRLPLPKRSNMRLLSHGTVQAFWTGVAPNNKILRQPLQAKLKGNPPPSEIYKADFEQLSISNILFKELVEPVEEPLNDKMVKFVPARTAEGGATSSYISSRPNKLKKYRDGEFSASGNSGVAFSQPSDSLENRISTSKVTDRDLYPDLSRDEVEWIISEGLHKTIHPSGPVPSTQLARTILFSIRNLRFVEGVSFFDARQDIPPDEIDHLLAIMFYQRLNTSTPTSADSIFDTMMNRLCTNNDLCREKSLIYVNRALKKLISSTYKKELIPYFFSDPKHPERVLDLVVVDLIPNYPVRMSEEMPYRFGRTRKLDGLSSGYPASSSTKYHQPRYDDHYQDWEWEKSPEITSSDMASKPPVLLKRLSTSPKPLKIELPKSSKPEPAKIIPMKRSPSNTPVITPRAHAPPTGPAAMRNANAEIGGIKTGATTSVSLRALVEQEEVAQLQQKIQRLEADLQREKQLKQDQDSEWKKKLDEQQKLSMELNDNIMAVSLEERTRMLEEESILRDKLANEQLRHQQAEEMMVEELSKERQRRILAEEALEDVRRECRAPFIVPALMEAFIHVSRTTTVLMQSVAGNNNNAPTQATALPPTQEPSQAPKIRVKREWHD